MEYRLIVSRGTAWSGKHNVLTARGVATPLLGGVTRCASVLQQTRSREDQVFLLKNIL